MRFEKMNMGYFVLFLIIGAILGSALGTFLARLFPAISIINKSLTGPIGFNLEIISFSMKLNLSAIIGLLFGIFIFRKV